MNKESNLNGQYFEEHLSEGLKREFIDRHDLLRVLDHRLFNLNESDFPGLVEEAWNRRVHILGEGSKRRSLIISMGRVIGHSGEQWIDLRYNSYTDQIVDLSPVSY